MGQKQSWKRGPRGTEPIALVEATDNADQSRFNIRLEDPSATDDQIAESFTAFIFPHLEEHVEQRKTGAAALDLQHSVPVADQLNALGLSAHPRLYIFQRYVDGSPHGEPFTRTLETEDTNEARTLSTRAPWEGVVDVADLASAPILFMDHDPPYGVVVDPE